MKNIFAAAFLYFLSGFYISAQEPGFIRSGDGLIVYPYQSLDGSVKAVRLIVYADGIIRVTTAPVSYTHLDVYKRQLFY